MANQSRKSLIGHYDLCWAIWNGLVLRSIIYFQSIDCISQASGFIPLRISLILFLAFYFKSLKSLLWLSLLFFSCIFQVADIGPSTMSHKKERGQRAGGCEGCRWSDIRTRGKHCLCRHDRNLPYGQVLPPQQTRRYPFLPRYVDQAC